MIPGILLRFLQRLRFPYLFLIGLVILVADLIIPDFIPIADELLLAVGTLLLASLKKRKLDKNEDTALTDARKPGEELTN